ncbi:phage tape measure protein [Aeromonas encheleia]|uniref:hypothetical protein n=1 Tax=Aeromonas encheleia TaxID=73010 RepID=UPI0005B22E6A|nr:hypothetical protein [Aeromonas encheleia]VEG96470.1 phage tape measure protein [Aeromonas encheleia]
MSTSSPLKLALELEAKVTDRADLAALAGQVQELGPLSDETAAETERLASTLEDLSLQQTLIQQFHESKAVLTQLELATVLSRDKLEQLRREQQAGTGDAKALADQERLLAAVSMPASPRLASIPATLPRSSNACSVSWCRR